MLNDKEIDGDYIITDCKPIPDEFLESTNCKLIVRMGSGIDNINLDICKKRGIAVASTPDIPVNAVAEFTISQMIHSLRNIPHNLKQMGRALYMGREIRDCTIGIIGYGRIGKRVYELLKHFSPKEVLINDLTCLSFMRSLETILSKCDIITFHIPLRDLHINNENFITEKELNQLKNNAIIINTSRGAIINENDLYNWLINNPNSIAVLDVFKEEPYFGKLLDLHNVIATPHLASYTINTQHKMLQEAQKEVERFVCEKPLKNRII